MTLLTLTLRGERAEPQRGAAAEHLSAPWRRRAAPCSSPPSGSAACRTAACAWGMDLTVLKEQPDVVVKGPQSTPCQKER